MEDDVPLAKRNDAVLDSCVSLLGELPLLPSSCDCYQWNENPTKRMSLLLLWAVGGCRSCLSGVIRCAHYATTTTGTRHCHATLITILFLFSVGCSLPLERKKEREKRVGLVGNRQIRCGSRRRFVIPTEEDSDSDDYDYCLLLTVDC